MIEISKLSRTYAVRRLDGADTEKILGICMENTFFYRFFVEKPSREQVSDDMRITPPGIDVSHKYYIGFFRDSGLIAIMDLIDGYPAEDIAYIGFFMTKLSLQGRGVGSSIIGETCDYLKTTGKKAVRLAINKGNPQAEHFWRKNGFSIIREADKNGRPLLEAERIL